MNRSTVISVPIPFLVAAIAAALPDAARAQVRFGPHDGAHVETVRSDGVPRLNAIVFGDVDVDGDLDMLCVGNLSASYLCFNDHGGSFRRSVDLPVGTGRRAALVDVDGDGDLDAFVAGGRTAYGGTGGSALLRNDGLGNFTPSPTIPTAAIDTRRLQFADVDGDGDQDAVLFLEGGTGGTGPWVRCWRNDGLGNFVDATAATFPSTLYGSGELADIDGDGDPDLAIGNGWLRNDGSGTFATTGGTFTGGLMHVADFDGDGDPDVLTDRVNLNDGTGTFTGFGTLSWPYSTDGEGSSLVGDFDGDGRLDVAGTTGSAVPFLLRDTGGFVFADVSAAWFEPHARRDDTIDYSYTCSGAVDIDGDGGLDFATGGVEGRTNSSATVGIPPRVYVNAGGQRLADATRAAFAHVQDQAEAVDCSAAGDVDGDGDADLLLDGRLCRQNEAGQFDPPAGFLGGAARLHDVDGDGDLDLFSLRSLTSGGQPALLLNDGTGAFTSVTATHLPVATTSGGSLALGDVDGDGDADAVIGSTWVAVAPPLRLWRNDGTGHFTEDTNAMPPRPAHAADLHLADLDGDGDLDLVGTLGHHYAGPVFEMLLYTNSGAGVFTDVTATNLPPAVYARDLAVCDMDGDGDLDLAIHGAILRNNGNAVFTVTAGSQGLVCAADFDGDGLGDQVAEGYNGFTIAGHQYPWGWSAMHSVRAHDLDDDGDLDLVIRPLWGSPYQWSFSRSGLLHNLHRDLRVVAVPRVGRPYVLQLRAAGNGTQPTTAFVALGFARLAQPLAVQDFGRWKLDPQAMALLGFATMADADTAATLATAVPPSPALAGLPVSVQGLFVPHGNEGRAHFSAAVTHVLLP